MTVADATLLKPAVWTVGAWVKPAGATTTAQTLVRKGSGSGINYRLSIDANSLVPRLETCGSYVTSTVPLVQGQWNQVLGTYDWEQAAHLRQRQREQQQGRERQPATPRSRTCTLAPTPQPIGWRVRSTRWCSTRR